MHANDLLAELSQGLGLPRLALSELGTATVVVDDELALNFEVDADGGTLWIYAALGEPPAEGREAFFAHLLEANLFGRGSGGCTVALDRTRHELLITRGLELEHTDARTLEAALAALVSAARRLRAGASPAAPGHPEAAGDLALPLGALVRA